MSSINAQVLGPIAAHLSDWDTAHVELAIYGTDDAQRVAQTLYDFCSSELKCPPEATLFYRSSIGAVAGLILCDGRRVVIKAHQPDWTRERLREVARLQSLIAAGPGLAPRLVAGPSRLGRGFAIVEEYVDRGTIRNGHDAEVRRALAVSLHAVVEHLGVPASSSTLPPSLLTSALPGELWPRPHSKLFDFHATRRGAEYIDEVAAAARALMAPTGRRVTGHGDWRSEHVRFEGDKPIVAFDWDSLCTEREPALVGVTAHMFCADFGRGDIRQAPTFEEARAFVADYEDAAKRRFTPNERVSCGAAFAYSVAYTSRCGHAVGVDAREQAGSFQHLVWTLGTGLTSL
jgi:hypothetical protein